MRVIRNLFRMVLPSDRTKCGSSFSEPFNRLITFGNYMKMLSNGQQSDVVIQCSKLKGVASAMSLLGWFHSHISTDLLRFRKRCGIFFLGQLLL